MSGVSNPAAATAASSALLRSGEFGPQHDYTTKSEDTLLRVTVPFRNNPALRHKKSSLV